jgi:hypothetical protein
MATNVNVLGFQFSKIDGQPDQYPGLFNHMISTAGSTVGNNYVYAVKTLKLGQAHDPWWCGVVLKFRPGKLTPVMNGIKGKEKVTAKDLSGEGRSLDPTFFIANQKTGRGLYSHHHGATTLCGFGTLCHGIHRLWQKERRKEIQDSGLAPKDLKAALAQVKGELVLEQLVLKESFPKLVRKMQKVKEAQFVLSTVETRANLFRGFVPFSRREKIVFSLKDDTDSGKLADEFEALLSSQTDLGKLASLKVSGIGADGDTRTLHLEGNLDRFDQFDFDDALLDLVIDFEDLEKSLEKSRMIRRLYKLSQSTRTKAVLEST